MREIKFRAWNKRYGFFHPEHTFVLNPNGEVSYENEEGDWIEDLSAKLVISQYTGLLDKNGKEIYEGDIVKAENTQNIGEIKYVYEHGAYLVYSHDENGAYYEHLDTGLCQKYFKIIGNTYENPELLEGGRCKMKVVSTEKLINFIQEYSYIGCSGFGKTEQEDNLIDWIDYNLFKTEESCCWEYDRLTEEYFTDCGIRPEYLPDNYICPGCGKKIERDGKCKMKQKIKNLIGKWRDVLIDREEALDRWSGSLAVADELQAQIDLALEIISGLEGLLKEVGE